jgi:predicted double-glycine peptidase
MSADMSERTNRRTTLEFRPFYVVLAALASMNLGCATYQGSAKPVQPSAVARSADWVVVPHFPLVRQDGAHDCGAAALSAVLAFWGRSASPEQIAAAEGRTGQQLRADEIERYARTTGLSSYVFFGTMADIAYELGRGRPVIVGVGKDYKNDRAVAHYEVVVGYEPKSRRVLLLDPGRGWQEDSFEGFAREWAISKGVTIVAFLPDPGAGISSR